MCVATLKSTGPSQADNNDSSACLADVNTTNNKMTYEAKTDEGKKMIADGADPEVVKGVEEEAGTTPEPKVPEHVENPEEDKPEEKPDKVVPEETEQPIDRTPQHMPIWKHKEELKKREEELQTEFQTKLEEAVKVASHKPDGATNEDVNKLAEEFNLTPEVASSMIDRMAQVVSSRIGIDDIRKNTEAIKEERRLAAEETGFENEFVSEDTTKAIESAANGKSITSDVKKRIKEFAYSTTYAKYRLADIVRLEADNLFPDKSESRPAESSRGGSARGSAQKNIAEMSPDEINSLSDAEFVKLSNELGKEGSKYGHITRVKR